MQRDDHSRRSAPWIWPWKTAMPQPGRAHPKREGTSLPMSCCCACALRACSTNWLVVHSQLATRQGGADLAHPASVPCYMQQTLGIRAGSPRLPKPTRQQPHLRPAPQVSSAGSGSGANRSSTIKAVLCACCSETDVRERPAYQDGTNWHSPNCSAAQAQHWPCWEPVMGGTNRLPTESKRPTDGVSEEAPRCT